jgi:hypothetical protein
MFEHSIDLETRQDLRFNRSSVVDWSTCHCDDIHPSQTGVGFGATPDRPRSDAIFRSARPKQSFPVSNGYVGEARTHTRIEDRAAKPEAKLSRRCLTASCAAGLWRDRGEGDPVPGARQKSGPGALWNLLDLPPSIACSKPHGVIACSIVAVTVVIPRAPSALPPGSG